MSHTALDSLSLRVQAEQIAASYVPRDIPGRPSNLEDADKVQRFLAYLSDGNYRDTACRASGFSLSSLKRYMDRAEAGDEAAIAFRAAVERAEADAESETVRNVRNASKLPQFWAAGMTYLERKSPEKWGRRTDESAAPKVIVQVGGHASDVKVLIQGSETPFRPPDLRLDEGRKPDANPLGTQTYASSSCPITAVMVTSHDHVPARQAIAVHPAAGARFAEGPASEGGAPQRAGFSDGKALEARRAHRRELQRARRASVKAARARVEEKRARRRMARQPKEA